MREQDKLRKDVEQFESELAEIKHKLEQRLSFYCLQCDSYTQKARLKEIESELASASAKIEEQQKQLDMANKANTEIVKKNTNLKGALLSIAKRINCEECHFNEECVYRVFADVEGNRECLGAEKIAAYYLAHSEEPSCP